MAKLERTSVQISEETIKYLEDQAKKKGVTRSQIVRDSIRSHRREFSLGRLFSEIIEWQRETLPKRTSEGAFNKLKEETAEAYDEFKWGKKEKLSLELADIFFMWAQIVDLESIDIEYAIAAKLLVNKRRTWLDPDKNGVISHVKD